MWKRRFGKGCCRYTWQDAPDLIDAVGGRQELGEPPVDLAEPCPLRLVASVRQ